MNRQRRDVVVPPFDPPHLCRGSFPHLQDARSGQILRRPGDTPQSGRSSTPTRAPRARNTTVLGAGRIVWCPTTSTTSGCPSSVAKLRTGDRTNLLRLVRCLRTKDGLSTNLTQATGRRASGSSMSSTSSSERSRATAASQTLPRGVARRPRRLRFHARAGRTPLRLAHRLEARRSG